jgi:hypothetical protein
MLNSFSTTCDIKMKTLIIKESKWLQGNKESSYLLDGEGKMCCLGFLGKACGATDDQIRHLASPAKATEVNWIDGLVINGYSKFLINSSLCAKMMSVNDSKDLSLEDRKTKLRPLFKQIGITLRFTK